MEYVDETGVYRRTIGEAPRPAVVPVVMPAPEPVPDPELVAAEGLLQSLMAKLEHLRHPKETK